MGTIHNIHRKHCIYHLKIQTKQVTKREGDKRLYIRKTFLGKCWEQLSCGQYATETGQGHPLLAKTNS